MTFLAPPYNYFITLLHHKLWGVGFNYLTRREGTLKKMQKGERSMVQGEVFLKGRWGSGTFPI